MHASADNSLPEKTPLPEHGRIAGIDFGTVRIGIATADLDVGIATPYENYTRRTLALDAEYFRALAQQERLVRFVVGLPVHLSGQESQKSQESRAFGAWLQELTGVEVVYFDERFTSSEAEHLLGAARLTARQRKERLDKLAAQIMLSAYLESHNRDASPGGLDD